MNRVCERSSEKAHLRFSKIVLDSFLSLLPLRYEYREFDAEGRASTNGDWIRPGVDPGPEIGLQLDGLGKAGCKRIFTDKLSGAQLERPGLKEALSHLREADTLVVWKLDRLGRSVKGLVDLVNELEASEGAFPKHHRRGRHQDPRRALLLSRHGESSPDGARADPGAHPCRVGGRSVRRTRRGPEASDDRRRGCGSKKPIGKRHAATRGGAQLRCVGPHVISMGSGLFAGVRGCDWRWTIH
jgi:hypothetical protein